MEREKIKEIVITYIKDEKEIANLHRFKRSSKYYDVYLTIDNFECFKSMFYLVLNYAYAEFNKYDWYLYRTDRIPPLTQGSHKDFDERREKEVAKYVKLVYVDNVL